MLSKVGSAQDAVRLIKDGATLGIPSGDRSSCPGTFLSVLREEIVRRSSTLDLRLFTVGPAPDVEEDLLALPNVRGRKYGQLSSRQLREAVNAGRVQYVETRVGLPAYQMGQFGRMDLAVLEITGITGDGHLIPSTTLGDGPAYVALADRVIIEINPRLPAELEGMHDVYLLDAPPKRTAVPLSRVGDRIGMPYIPVSPDKIALIIESAFTHTPNPPQPVDKESEIIAGHLLEFLKSEVKHNRLPANLLPLQFGIGSIPEAISGSLAGSDFSGLEVFSGAIGDGVLDLIDAGRVRVVSTGCLYLSDEGFKRLFGALAEYKRYIILRPSEIADCPEIVARLGVIGINGAVEVDIYGQVNSTHVSGSKSVSGIGGSCDFAWNAYLSVFAIRSTSAGGNISTIVPMVTHVDHPEHAVDVIVTERGLADLRGLGPVERARTIIANCAHPAYKPLLAAYLEEAVRGGGHEPHTLSNAFKFHHRFAEKGTMRSDEAVNS